MSSADSLTIHFPVHVDVFSFLGGREIRIQILSHRASEQLCATVRVKARLAARRATWESQAPVIVTIVDAAQHSTPGWNSTLRATTTVPSRAAGFVADLPKSSTRWPSGFVGGSKQPAKLHLWLNAVVTLWRRER